MTAATANAFNYGLTQSLAEMTLPPILTAARWGVLTYDALTSTEARQTYAWLKGMATALGQLAFWSVVLVYAKTSAWVDAEVQAAIPSHVEAAPVQTAAATIASPCTTLTVVVPAPGDPLTSADLRRQCQAEGIRWRNAHGKGKHLSKNEMIAALG